MSNIMDRTNTSEALNELNFWRGLPTNVRVDISHAVAKIVAAADRADPTAFRRAFSRMVNGVETPVDNHISDNVYRAMVRARFDVRTGTVHAGSLLVERAA